MTEQEILDRAFRVGMAGNVNDPAYLAMVMLNNERDFEAVQAIHDSPDFNYTCELAYDIAEDNNHGIDMAELTNKLALAA